MDINVLDLGILDGHVTSSTVLMYNKEKQPMVVAGTVYLEDSDQTIFSVAPYGFDAKLKYQFSVMTQVEGNFNLGQLMSAVADSVIAIIRQFPDILDEVYDFE